MATLDFPGSPTLNQEYSLNGRTWKWNGTSWVVIPISFVETDPTVPAHVKSITTTEKANWNTAYGWGDHSTAGYLTSYTETDPIFSASEAANITSTDTANWDTAYGWGNHSTEGYLTSYTETDPIFTASASYGISATDISNWNTAFGWGDHSTAGYLTSYTETDPVFSASEAASITSTDTTNWDTAYGWGNHASAGYLTSYTETDPVFIASAASGISSTDITNWDTAYGWGDHSTEGYATTTYVDTSVANLVDSAPATLDTLNELAAALGDDPNFATTVSTSIGTKWTQDNTKISNWDTAYGWGDHASAGYLLSSSYTASDVLTKIKTVDGSGSGLDADLLDGIDSSRIVYGSNSNKTNNTGSASANLPSGFYDQYQGDMPTATYYSYLNIRHTSVSNHHGAQIAVSFYSPDLYTRHYQGGDSSGNGSFSAWDKHWRAGNDGSGSGLDADLLDGVHGSSFLRSDAADTATGPITFQNSNDAQIYLNGNGTTWAGIGWTDSGGTDYLWFNGANKTFSIGGSGSNVAGKKLHVDGGTSIGSGFDAAAVPTEGLRVQGLIWDNNTNVFSAYRHSGSNFVDGTLVRTDIPATAANGASFVIEVTGKSYSSTNPPFSFIAQGYLYNSTITSYSGVNNGNWALTYIKAMELGGYLCFWWPRISYWNSFEVRVRDADGSSENRVTSIENSVDPAAATKKVQINLAISWTSNNDGSGSGLDADTLDGLQPSVSASNNTIVQRHSSGYIFANFFNTTPNDVSSGVTKVCVETGNDGYIRHGTPDAVALFLDGVSGGSISYATNGGGVNYVYVDSTVTYTPTRGSCGNHVYQCWGGALTLNLSDASWQKGDVVVVSNVKGDTSITVNATAIYLPNNTSDTQVTWNSKVGSFRLCKYNDATGYWMVLP